MIERWTSRDGAWDVRATFHDSFEEQCRVLVVEGRIATQENVQDHASTPHVHGGVVAAALEDLRS